MTSRHTEPDLHDGQPRHSSCNFIVPGYRNVQLINVGMEDAIDEAYAGALVGILVGQLDVDFPGAALERGCSRQYAYVPSDLYYSILSSGPLNRT